MAVGRATALRRAGTPTEAVASAAQAIAAGRAAGHWPTVAEALIVLAESGRQADGDCDRDRTWLERHAAR